MVPLDKLAQITERFEYLEAQLNAGAAPAEIARISREYTELKPVVEEIRAYRQALAELLARSSTPLPLIGRPATDALAIIGVTCLERVIEHSQAELLGLHGVGPKAIGLLADELDRLGWGWSRRGAA